MLYKEEGNVTKRKEYESIEECNSIANYNMLGDAIQQWEAAGFPLENMKNVYEIAIRTSDSSINFNLKEESKNLSLKVISIYLHFIDTFLGFDLDSEGFQASKESLLKSILKVIEKLSKDQLIDEYLIETLNIMEYIVMLIGRDVEGKYAALVFSITRNCLASLETEDELQHTIPIAVFSQYLEEHDIMNHVDSVLIYRYFIMILHFYFNHPQVDEENIAPALLLKLPNVVFNDSTSLLFYTLCLIKMLENNRVPDEEVFSTINLFLEQQLFKTDFESRGSFGTQETRQIILLIRLYKHLSMHGYAIPYDISLPISIFKAANSNLINESLDFIRAVAMQSSNETKYQCISFLIESYSELAEGQKQLLSYIIGDLINSASESNDLLINNDLLTILVESFQNINLPNAIKQAHALVMINEFCVSKGEDFISVLDSDLLDILNDYCSENSNEASELLLPLITEED